MNTPKFVNNNNITKVIFDSILDGLSYPNERPINIIKGDIWATHSGYIVIKNKKIKFHKLSDGNHIFDVDDVDNYFKKGL